MTSTADYGGIRTPVLDPSETTTAPDGSVEYEIGANVTPTRKVKLLLSVHPVDGQLYVSSTDPEYPAPSFSLGPEEIDHFRHIIDKWEAVSTKEYK